MRPQVWRFVRHGLIRSFSVGSEGRKAPGAPAPFTVIDIPKVAPATTALREVPFKVGVEAQLNEPVSSWLEEREPVHQPVRTVEACSHDLGRLVANVDFHPFVAAVHLAFKDHRPLVLSPDMIWLLVAQGLASHIHANAEELRPRFIEQAGKVAIVVRRDDFIKGSPENPWPEVFRDFSSKIRDHVGAKTHDLLMPNFSTRGVVERSAAEVVLLDAVQSFFSYQCRTMCGIPQIGLEGTPADWETLAERIRGIGQIGLMWWTEALGPILDEFIAAARGHANPRFWKFIYNQDHDASGGPFTTGWITAFFPYLKERKTGLALDKNPWLANGGEDTQRLLYPPEKIEKGQIGFGPTTACFPCGLARAPFLWEYLGNSFRMEFLGGFVGVRQDLETLRLRPEIGWAIRERTTV